MARKTDSGARPMTASERQKRFRESKLRGQSLRQKTLWTDSLGLIPADKSLLCFEDIKAMFENRLAGLCAGMDDFGKGRVYEYLAAYAEYAVPRIKEACREADGYRKNVTS
jgi:hypothetical protein